MLARELEQVLGEVRAVVEDFGPMKARLHELLASIDANESNTDVEEKAEIKVFLQWLVDNHFTFLGYEEFEVRNDAEGGQLVYDESSFPG